MNPVARVIMVQGTASHAGKSFLTAGLLRWLSNRGYRVAPFKAQNMALNSAVTADGKEIGRAQAEQALAARVQPHEDMNPVLLKPESGHRSQLVVLGRVEGTFSYREYGQRKSELKPLVLDALSRLRSQYDVIVVEGAGSPAEINLKSGDFVNMGLATAIEAPVLLITDVDRGGAFASLYGTWALLSNRERSRLRGFVMNRIRGDPDLLAQGYGTLTDKTNVPVLGAIPYLTSFVGAEEDSLGLDERRHRPRAPWDAVEVTVVELPHISNYDEFRTLETHVTLRYARNPREGYGTDLLILPGSKCTSEDLAWLRATGWADVIAARRNRGERMLGICGGCQILGTSINEEGVERPGLGLLPFRTQFHRDKRTRRVQAQVLGLSVDALDLEGYEIHRGRLTRDEGAQPFCIVTDGHQQRADGAVANGVAGTMVHGLFESPAGVNALLQWIHPKAGPGPLGPDEPNPLDPYDDLADVLERHLDLKVWMARELSITS